jgi:hypothetical protein
MESQELVTKTRRIVLCDDDSRRVETWAASIRALMSEPEWEVTTYTGTELVHVIRSLAARERGSRTGDTAVPEHDHVLDPIDSADIVMLDSDLQPDPTEVSNTPNGSEIQDALRNQRGDVIARQVRSFTSAKFVAVVNMYWRRHSRRRTFDLTMQQGADTFADLHLREGELGDASLWLRSDDAAATAASFNPWSRPVLSDAPDVVDRSIAVVELGAGVIETLELASLLDELDPAQFDAFGDVDIETATFNDLVEHSPLGFMYPTSISPEAAHDEAARKRVAAAIVRNWLTRSVVAAQDVISDAPHLVARFPQFLGDGIDDPLCWNATARKSAGAAIDVLPSAAEAELTAVAPFLDRPVFSVSAARRLVPRLARTKPAPDLVFAENASIFVPRDDASEYESDLSGTLSRRHALKLEDEDAANEPFRRFLL